MNRYIKVTGLFSLIRIISLSILGVRGNLINAKAIVKLCTNPIVKESPSKIQDLCLNTFMEGYFISIIVVLLLSNIHII